jgi:hypothetical protein
MNRIYQKTKEKLLKVKIEMEKFLHEYIEGWVGTDFEKAKDTSILNGGFTLCLLLMTAPYWSINRSLAEKAIYSALFGGSFSFIMPYISYLKRKRKDKNLS